MVGERETPYHELQGFDGYYLEDSWVLGIHLTGSELSFDLNLVLRESHPEYTPPKPNEQYCYRSGRLSFPRPRRITFGNGSSLNAASDATGTVDFSNIDSMRLIEGKYHLEVDRTSLEVESEAPFITLGDDIPAR